ncbi:MAG TPA: KTSC domain-containing protein [Polyangiales bacterium]
MTYADRMLRGMQRTPLNSRAVLAAGYDPATQTLELEFHNGRVYRYRDVPEGVYQFLLRTPSKGGYVNRMIQDRYAYEDVTPTAPAQDVLAALRASLEAVDKDRG